MISSRLAAIGCSKHPVPSGRGSSACHGDYYPYFAGVHK
jgi:hypothetical protein